MNPTCLFVSKFVGFKVYKLLPGPIFKGNSLYLRLFKKEDKPLILTLSDLLNIKYFAMVLSAECFCAVSSHY
jgi:hypothetical protein